MHTLVLNPPVSTPAEPPAGGFVLAAALAGHGLDVGLLDLSLELYHRVLEATLSRGTSPLHPDAGPRRDRTLRGALGRLLTSTGGYDPGVHASDLGHLHQALGRFGAAHPGWKLTLMDLTPEVRVTAPARLAAWMRQRPSPFDGLWQEVLDPVLEAERPRQVAVSLSYLSQLAATIDLVGHLRGRGEQVRVGGSLVRSLATTGQGLDLLVTVLGPVDAGDGGNLLGRAASSQGDAGVLSRLAWPRLVSAKPYLTSRPIVPVPLSVGCYWRRCLFCPDRDLPFQQLDLEALGGLLSTLPADVKTRRPVLHLLDSALPTAHLTQALPLFREHGVGFYGFARPTRPWLAGDLLGACADAGGLMLQFGLEGGSRPLLDRYQKGLDPAQAEVVVREAAAVGIRTYLYLLFGLPGERDADRALTLEMLDRLGRAQAADFLNLSLFNLPAESELARRAGERGITLLSMAGGALHNSDESEGDLRLYRAFSWEGTDPRQEARRYLSKTLPQHQAARAAQRRTPKWLRAAHLALYRLPGRRGPGPDELKSNR